MNLFRLLIRQSRTTFWIAILAGVVSGAASTGLLAVIHRALGDETIDAPPPLEDPWLLWSFVGLCILMPASRLLSQQLLVHLGQDAMMSLRLELARRILATPLARLEQLGTPRLMAALTDDVSAISIGVIQAPNLSITSAVVLGCLGFLAYLSVPLFLVLLVVMVLGILSYQLPGAKGVAHMRKAREQQDRLFGHFRDLTEGVRELKLHHRRRGAFLDLLAGTAGTLRGLYNRANLYFNASASWGQVLFFLVVGVFVFLLAGRPGYPRSTLVGYTLVLLYMTNPLRQILDSMPTLGRAGVSVDKVAKLELALEEASAGRGGTGAAEQAPAPPAPAWSRLELAGLTYTYPADDGVGHFTLGPLDLTFRPGEIVFLVGGNGSGKTSLGLLLAGLYTPDGGEIRLDGRPVVPAGEGAGGAAGTAGLGAAGATTDLEAYRQLFTMVLAQPHLFEQLLGLSGPDLDADARRYLERLRIDHKVEVKDGALSTTALSKGERKRLALVTAYLEDRPFYIFDEWAADQDPTFREIFYHQLLPELRERGKTVLVISHDDRYFDRASRILELDYGQLVFDGTYENWKA